MIITAPIFSLSVIIVILCALTVLFVFLELKKKRGYRAARVLAIAIMMISLAGIMLRPKYPTASSRNVLLLTPGYSEQQADSILKQNPGLLVMHLSNTKQYPNSEPIRDHQISNQKIYFVIGEGLPLHYLDRMENPTFRYIPTPLPEGLVGLTLEENYQPHRKGTISGIYNNNQGDTYISLRGPTDTEDSVIIHQKGHNQFSLSFIPRQPGNFAYSLIVGDSAKTTRETIPIHVDDERQLNILFLQYYPTFETQHLKSYLADKNHSMVLRYQLTKNKFRHEFVNHEAVSIARLSEQLLSNFDLVIADVPSLAKLSSQEKGILQKSVRLGLGLLTLAPIEKKQTNFFPFETIAIKTDTTSVRLGEKSIILPASSIRIKKNQSVVPLHINKSGILSGYAFQHAGKIGFQLLHETYRLRLSGDSLAYAEIWAPILEKIARRKWENAKIKIVTPFPWYENEPLQIEVISSGDNITLLDDSTQIPLREDVNVDNVWHGRTWASKKGWHSFQTNEGTVRPYYIQSRPAWNSLLITNQIRINSLKGRKNADESVNKMITMKDIPPIFFYVVLILSVGYMWLSPKL